ncbi:hypothetical protein BT96DRAFT_1000376 [Gymnopus androsaceus JB14]|uniref:Uncharacterized protein n=1 Tax=Gymnopus androsaceus JB14 TaxID=1447944 RepID=A0A6A4H3Y5_9AGAR|nr:hypothetical protein BT96DRAFT_1000376 [Gymnopus androsaceus JB14]
MDLVQSHTAPTVASFSPNLNQLSGPLFRVGPLLRVFVPSPEGDWLSDASVLECEAELKHSNVFKMVIWDGSYLIDLDYTYSPIGDLRICPWTRLPAFVFPSHHTYRHFFLKSRPNGDPSRFISQTLFDGFTALHSISDLPEHRVTAEHLFVLVLLPPPHRHVFLSPAAPSLSTPGWYGKVVVETEGYERGIGRFAGSVWQGRISARTGSNVPVNMSAAAKEANMVYRSLRERRAVSRKEQLM